MSEDPNRPETQDDDLPWETVRSFGTEEEATLVVGYLRANDVPAEMESVRFNQEPVNFGDMSDVRVRVPEEHLQAALALLSDRQVRDLGAEADAAERATEGTVGGPGGTEAE